MILNKTLALTLLLLTVFNVSANVVLPPVLTDNMVLQQKTNAGIWGSATPMSTVRIYTSWNKKSYTAKADAKGNWKTDVVTPVYGGPYEIVIEEGNRIVLKNILIGEVWLCSGQSNMEMPLAGWGQVTNYASEIEKANYPEIRLLQAIRKTSNQPATDIEVRNNGWDICTPATIGEFSSTAYFFARELYQKTKIPVGLIHSSWGGTIAEAWTSYETLKTIPDFAAAAESIRNQPEFNIKEYEAALANWSATFAGKDEGYKNNWESGKFNESEWETMTLPQNWEAGRMVDYDGAVWFKKRLSLSEEWQGKELLLSLGTIDDEDVTWVNGVKVGGMPVYNAERVYKIPANVLQKGENVIAVRVMDHTGNGGFYGDPLKMFLQNADGKKMSLAGNWSYKPSVSVKDMPPLPQRPDGPNRPAVLYNAMINPIINYKIRGAIWYQGEGNAGRAYQYRTLLPALIKDWRTKFSSGDFPFYIVQLANFMKTETDPGPSAWAELREAQLMTSRNVKNSGLANAIDIGDAIDIHPKNKQEVGRRLALIALNQVYKKQNEYSGPLYASFKKEANKIRVRFAHSKGLHARGDRVLGFSVAGEDKKFYWADAKIEGNEIVVQSENVKNPVAVRYGWANNPEVNLYNDSQLPAVPFRTDDWPGITHPNK